jgi:thymidylate kinase
MLVIFDRYYDDILCDPRRYRYGGPLWLARFGRWLVPKPDVTFYLNASPETIQSRKQEVSLEETRRQVAAYESLAAGQIRHKENVHLVSTTQSIEAAVQEIVQKVLTVLSKRLENSHGS